MSHISVNCYFAYCYCFLTFVEGYSIILYVCLYLLCYMPTELLPCFYQHWRNRPPAQNPIFIPALNTKLYINVCMLIMIIYNINQPTQSFYTIQLAVWRTILFLLYYSLLLLFLKIKIWTVYHKFIALFVWSLFCTIPFFFKKKFPINIAPCIQKAWQNRYFMPVIVTVGCSFDMQIISQWQWLAELCEGALKKYKMAEHRTLHVFSPVIPHFMANLIDEATAKWARWVEYYL